MNALEQFQAGQLDEAIAAQNEQVKSRPTDADARFQLFVFLCFAGDLDRAEKQLDVLGSRDQKLQMGTVVFRNLLASEVERRRVVEGKGRPVLPPGCPAYVGLRVDAVRALARGDTPGAVASVEKAVAATPQSAGRIDDEPFDDLCDFDDVLGSVIEVFAGGRCLWLPLQHVRRIGFSEPATALDTLWVPADLEDAAGETAHVHLPSLYALSHAHAEPRVRLGRESDWEEIGPLYRGHGQRVWMSASGDETREHPLLSVRRLELADAAGS